MSLWYLLNPWAGFHDVGGKVGVACTVGGRTEGKGAWPAVWRPNETERRRGYLRIGEEREGKWAWLSAWWGAEQSLKGSCWFARGDNNINNNNKSNNNINNNKSNPQ